MVSSPKPPDPDKTAAAQTGMNRDTALTEAQLAMVNQITPDGSLTYNQTGTNSFIDSKGNVVKTPSYTATTSLSPQQQAIKAQTDAASLNLGTLANQQSAAIKDQLAKPFRYDNKDAENWAYDLASQRILPQQQKAESALRERLISSGLRPGTSAYASEMTRQMQGNNDQLNQLALNGRQQGYQESLATYNNPLNSISALMSGSQVQQPNFVSTPAPNVAGVDYAGMVNSNYQAKVSQSNAGMGGLFGLGAGIIKAIPWSDVRLKKDIVPLGQKKSLPWYGFRYIWESSISPLHYGFMAQEAITKFPEHVHLDRSGFYKVDLDAILEAA